MHAAFHRALPACAFAAIAASAGTANADTPSAVTTTFKASADARVERAHPTTHYGRKKVLRGKASPEVRSYLKFDVAGLPGSVTSAKLKIYPTTSSAKGFHVRAARQDPWTERGITWSTQPGMSKAIAGVSGRFRAHKGYVAVDVTKLVKGDGPLTLVLTGAGNRANQFRSREAGKRFAPKLVVTTGAVANSAAPAAGAPSTTSSPGTATTGSAVHTVQASSTGAPAGGSPSSPASPAAPLGVPGRGGGTSTGPTSYVSPSGSDSNTGSQSAPWKTIGKAATAVPAGGNVVIMGGTYNESVTLAKAGTAESPTTFQANGNDTVKITSLAFKGSHIVAQGLTISGASDDCVSIGAGLTDVGIRRSTMSSCGADGVGFDKSGTYTSGVLIGGNKISNVGRSNQNGNLLTVFGDKVLVQDNEMTGGPNDVVTMWGDSHTYRHNNIHDVSNSTGNHNDAFQTWTGLGDGAEGKPVTNLTIEDNKITDVTGPDSHALMSEGPGHKDWTIRNNVLKNVGNIGFILGKDGNGQGIQNVKVSHNTFVGGGTAVEFNVATSGVAANNIFFNSGGMSVAGSAKVTRDYNLAGGSSPKLSEAHGKNGDPKFASAADFHLQAGSPAINAGDGGSIINPVRAGDLDGTPTNGVNDIGAYEAR